VSARIATWIGIAAAALVLSAIAIALSPVFPDLPSAVNRPLVAGFTGAGPGATDEMVLKDGWFGVSWSASAFNEPAKGCQFGLLLDEVGEEEIEGEGPRVGFRQPKLDYRAVPAGAGLHGDAPAMHLAPGRYRFIVDGGCAWQVLVVATPAGDTKEDDGIEQSGPRM
jgi:hypothetical protein